MIDIKNNDDNILLKSIANVEELQVGITSLEVMSEEVENQIIEINNAMPENEKALVDISGASTVVQNSANILTDRMKEDTIKLNEVAEKITSINKSYKDILDIAEFISEIHLIIRQCSINALIEAAHAGIQGKGFGIIAEEIRRLSESTGKEVSRVKTIIKNIDNELSSSKEKIDLVVKDFKKTEDETFDNRAAIIELTASNTELAASFSQVSKSTIRITEEIQLVHEVCSEIKKNEGSIEELRQYCRDQIK